MQKINNLITKYVINKISNKLFDFSNWLEFRFSENVTNLGRRITSIGRKISPNSYCSRCGVFFEECYYTDPKRTFCCNCENPKSKQGE